VGGEHPWFTNMAGNIVLGMASLYMREIILLMVAIIGILEILLAALASR
jgi:hypothetical protein